MHDFGKIAYLDLHKTGSTYVSQFLNSCCLLEQIRFSKHDWVREDYKPNCFYFITIRNPYDLWSSLYRYGLDGKGDVFSRLSKYGLLNQYESFDKFINFCLDDKNAKLLGYDFNSEISKNIGFMSFRFLKLSLQFPMKEIYQCLQDGKDFCTLESKFITKLEIKNEKLNEGLLRLSLNIFPQYFNDFKVQKFIDAKLRINESKTLQNNVDCLTEDTSKQILKKEWLLMSRYT